MGVYSSRCEECIDSQVLPTLERRGVAGPPGPPVVSTNTAVPRASQTSAHAGVVDALATGTKLLDTDVLGGILYQPQVPSVWVVAPGTNLAFTYQTDGTFVAYFVAIWVEVPV